MKERNRELDKIAKQLDSYVSKFGISASENLLIAQDNIRLAIFEDEKTEAVLQFANELKQECDNSTEIAEEIASYFHVDFDGGPLDNPDHWIWEIAL